MCEHGWHSETDCDICTGRRVAPELSDRIDEMRAELRKWLDHYDGSDPLVVQVPRYQIERLLK